MIKAEGVSVAYENNIILRDIYLHIKEHEFIVVVGPNGSGKTTLLAMINGLASVKGRLTIKGQAANSRTYPQLRKSIGYVPQNWPVDQRIPVSLLELILSGRCGRKGFFSRYTKEDYKEAKELAQKLCISHLIDRPVGQLSGGEFQKGTIARAIFQNPDILLLDEPTSSLDWQAGQELIKLIRQLHDANRLTTIMVTHELQMIPGFANRVLIMRNGSIAADGPPKEILQREFFARTLGWKAVF